MDNNPTFAERTAALKLIANELRVAAEVILSEAQRMEAAQKRFAQRVGKGATARKGKSA